MEWLNEVIAISFLMSSGSLVDKPMENQMTSITYTPPAEGCKPIWLYTPAQLAAVLLPNASAWTQAQVASALEELAKHYIHQGITPKLNCTEVIKEVREMNMSYETRDDIVVQLEMIHFECQWVVPAVEQDAQGFELLSHAIDLAAVLAKAGQVYVNLPPLRKPQ